MKENNKISKLIFDKRIEGVNTYINNYYYILDKKHIIKNE